MEKASSLPDTIHTDPADRIITATAGLNRHTILTADKKYSRLSSGQFRLVENETYGDIHKFINGGTDAASLAGKV